MTFDSVSNTYSYTFSTKVTEAQKSAITNTNVRNKAKLEYDGGWTDEAETGVTVPGSYKGISKTHAENQDGSVTWTITVPVPASGAEKITVKDWFDIEPYDYNARQNINKSLTVAGMTFTVDGVNYPDAAVKEWDNDGSGMQFYFKSEFLADVKGKDIVITYTTPEELLTDNIIRVTNNTIVYIDDITVPQVSDTYLNADPNQYKGEKTVLNSENCTWLNDGNYRMPMVWSIKLDDGKISAGMRQFSSGDIITIKDTIPEGLVLIDGKYMMNCQNNISQWDADQYVNQGCFAVSQNGNVVTFTITVNDYLEEKLHQWDGEVPLYVFYGTQMTEDKYNEIYSEFGKFEFTNSAEVNVKNGSETIGKDITLHAAATVEADPDKIVKKAIKEVHKATAEDPNVYVTYEIKVNTEAHDIVSGDELTVKDTLGTSLELVEEPEISPVISPANNGEAFAVNGNELTFSLKDNTAYTITYKAKVKVIGLNDQYTDAEITAKFGNTIEVTLSDKNSVSSSVCVSESEYRSNASYDYVESESMITIKGTKMWSDTDSSLRPEEITVVLTKHIYPKSGTESTEELNYSFPAPEAGKDWTYSIDKLVTLSADETKYTYDIKEVSVDGYSVSYSTDKLTGITKVGDTDEFTIDITNTWNVDENGSLTVKKVWSDNVLSADDRPAVEITVKSNDGKYDVTKKLNNTDTQLVFNDMPLYTYTRGADGKLIRTPVEYSVTEGSCEGYTVTYDVNGEFTLTDNTTDKTAEKTVTVTNTQITETIPDDEKGSLTVIKVWSDNNLSAGEHPAVDITVKSKDGKYDVTKKLNNTDTQLVFNDMPLYTYTRGADGKLIRTPVEYSVTEGSCEGYTVTYDVNGEFTLTDNITDKTAEKTVTVTNTQITETIPDDEKGSLTVIKVWSDNNLSAGEHPVVEITVNSTDGKYNVTKKLNNTDTQLVFDNMPLYTYETGAYGKLIRTPVEYSVTEGSCEGYKVTYEVNGGFTLTDNITDKTAEKTVTVTNTLIPETEIVINKTNENGEPLIGAKFSLTNETAIYNAVSAADGTVRFSRIKAGTYKLTETEAPVGYKKDDKEYEIIVTEGADGNLTVNYGNGETSLTVVNEPETIVVPVPGKCNVSFVKTDLNGAALPNAEFMLYTADNTVNMEAVSDANGVVTFADVLVGSYFIKETKPPEGYKLNEQQFSVNVFEENGLVKYEFSNGSDKLTFTNEPIVPVGPEEPEPPVGPEEPKPPVGPEEPEPPVGPEEPEPPVGPEEPEPPVGPEEPEPPVGPEEPEPPVYPIYPEPPIYPVYPIYPIYPIYPVDPVDPVNPEDISAGAGIEENGEANDNNNVVGIPAVISFASAVSALAVVRKKRRNK